MKLAIVGAGFSGLSAAWHLLQYPNVQVTLYDALPIGQSTSGMAAGLLHPYAGLHAKKNWRGDEGMAAALPLLDIASKAYGQPIYRHTGLLRVAFNPQAEEDFRSTAEKHPDVEWLPNCQTKLPELGTHPGIFIHNAYQVSGNLYLQGLWQACMGKKCHFIQERVLPATLLHDYDCVIAATGGQTASLLRVKGQLLQVSWPKEVPPLLYPISSQHYIVMDWDDKSCFVGGTYERPVIDENPERERAIEELWPKALELFPPLAEGKIIQVKAGIRSTTPNHIPFLEETAPRFFTLAGMGSKGLLYSALYAQELALRIAQRF